MEHTSLTSLMIVVAITFAIPILLHKLSLRFLPVVVAEILVGLIIGKSGFNIISGDPWLELLSMFGLIYLMFLSGLEIDFSQIRGGQKNKKKNGPNPFVAASLVFVGILGVSYALALALVWMGFVSGTGLITVIIATISLGVVVPILKERKLIETPLGQTILLVTVIADLVTMILLAVYVSMRSQSTGRLVLLLAFFAVVVVAYLLIKRFIRGRLADALLRGTSQIGTRGVFALIFVFVVLSEHMGVENILGAFLAGVVISLLAPDKSFTHQLESFGYGFLIPIFFIMVGVNLDIWSLLKDWTILLFIPILLVSLYISKMLPALLMRFWFSWRETLGSGILMSSTLSLVIAAATVALEIGVINEQLHGAFILVAILTCFISPIYFNRLVPKHEPKRPSIAMIGANHVTLPVAGDLVREGFGVEMFSGQSADSASQADSQAGHIPVTKVPALNVDALEQHGAFTSDVLVCGTMEEEANLAIARHARAAGVDRIIVRMEDPEKVNAVQQEGFTVFSTLYSSRILLKGLIEFPSAVRLITQHDDSLREIVVNNPAYHQRLLREFPFLGKALVLRVYRGDSFIIPHGSTEIQLGDRLLISGESQYAQQLKQELE